jgi:Aspartyl protease
MLLILLNRYVFILVYSSILFWTNKAFTILHTFSDKFQDTFERRVPGIHLPENSGIADSLSSIIPFSMAGNLILIQASADSTEGSFILDTGCPNLVLNLTYFRDYPVTSNMEEEKNGMSGTVASAGRTMVNTFSLGIKKYDRVEADLLNLGHIENSRGIKVLGLIGIQFFKNCEMIIDYEKSLIYLHWIGKKEAAAYQHEMLNDTGSYSTIPIDLTDNRIIIKTEMAGKKLKLIIDSGAETNVLDSRLPDKLFEEITISGRITLSGVGNKKVEALKGNWKSMRIGDQEIGSLPVLITNLEKTCFSYNGCVDGILGFDFLSLQKIGFNFVKRKMYLWR